MSLPRIILTGASGFIGRHLLENLKEDYRVFCIARRSQARCGAPVHSNIHWFQVDIGELQLLRELFRKIRDGGGADYMIHLAAHYDFTGENHPEYWRTNVQGLRNVLDLSRGLGLRRFLFSSSLAACAFPAEGRTLDESSPADGDHVYAQTKAIGEKMLDEYSDEFPSSIIRFAALFSDWCEYPPLFMFLGTWLSQAWNNRILGGKGLSAIPYLHVRDGVSFIRRLLEPPVDLDHGEVLIASPDGAVSHLDLLRESTRLHYGRARRPLHVPRLLVGPGIVARMLMGRFTGREPFERPWMSRYVDLQLGANASRTRQRLDWSPRPRLEILRRLPFLLENFKIDPVEWNRRNRAAMRQVRMRPNLKIHWLLEKHSQEIIDSFTRALTDRAAHGQFASYQKVSHEEHHWRHRMTLRHLMNAVRTRERAVFLSFIREIAEQRYSQGFRSEELCNALQEWNRICTEVLKRDPDSADILPYLDDHIATTIHFAVDQAQETFELLDEQRSRGARNAAHDQDASTGS